MKTRTEKAEALIDTLSEQIQGFKVKVQENQAESRTLSENLGRAMLDGGDVQALQGKLVALEVGTRGLEAAITEAERRLPAAQADLTAARQAEGQQRMDEIGEALLPVEEELLRLLEVAGRFDALLREAAVIHNGLGCSLTALGPATAYMGQSLAAHLDNALRLLKPTRN